MDFLKTSFPSIQFEAIPAAARSILQKLQQTGLFRALVIESKGQQVLLDTAFGKLKGQSPQLLNKGDEILARIVADQSRPTIKIEQIQTRQPIVPDKVLNQLIRLISNETMVQTQPSIQNKTDSTRNFLPQIIKVLEHSGQQTHILLGQKNYVIPRQNSLQPGETIMLRVNDRQQPELIRIAPRQVLKKAISELLPRLNAAPERIPGLVPLQKLITALLQLKPANLAHPEQVMQQIKKDITGLQQSPLAKTAASTSSPVNMRATPPPDMTATAAETSIKPPAIATPSNIHRTIEHLFRQLSRPIANAGRIDAESVKQVFTRLSLLSTTASQPVSLTALNIPQQIKLLQQVINQSPQALKELIAQVMKQAQPATQHGRIDETRLQEISSLFRSELLQQLELTSNQLLVHKSTLKLNLEQQQPIQINLNIPVQFKEENIALKLKLKQRHPPNEQPQSQQWEINLSFDLPLLGLISTHILLQDCTLSANFWAVNSHTKALIDSHLHQFKQQLVKSGFEVGLFNSYLGQPLQTDTEQHTSSFDQNLLDIKV